MPNPCLDVGPASSITIDASICPGVFHDLSSARQSAVVLNAPAPSKLSNTDCNEGSLPTPLPNSHAANTLPAAKSSSIVAEIRPARMGTPHMNEHPCSAFVVNVP